MGDMNRFHAACEFVQLRPVKGGGTVKSYCLPDKIWEFDEIIAKLKRVPYFTYTQFIERELFKHGEVAVRDSWSGNISYWRIPYPGVYNPETGQVW